VAKKRKNNSNSPCGGRRRVRVYGDQIPAEEIDLRRLALALIAAVRAKTRLGD